MEKTFNFSGDSNDEGFRVEHELKDIVQRYTHRCDKK